MDDMNKRPLIITLDGDGFKWNTNYDSRTVGEVFRDEIIKQYPFCFTASVVIDDVFGPGRAFYLNLAKEIFGLDNVEAASHSWSHPRDWQNSNINLEREIVESVNFINREILVKEKKVKVFLWTGRCNPVEDAFALLGKLNIYNLNSSKIDQPFLRVGEYVHYMSRAYPDWHYMELKKIWPVPYSDENYKAISCCGSRLDGFKNIVDYFKSNPDVPIHLWLHWYSAVRRESLDAVKFVLDWCLKQNARSIFASEYVSLILPG